MQKIFYLFTLFICHTAQAQLKVVTIHDVGPFENSTLDFPFIRSANANVANKINAFLQTSILENSTIITDPKQIFHNRKYIYSDSVKQMGFSDIRYEVTMNTARVLSLEFDLETMGAYGTNFKSYYSFDSQTGKPVLTKDIITAEGLNYLKKYLTKERRKEIVRFINDDVQVEDDTDTAYIKERFAECNKDAGVDNLFILNKNILFYKGFCFPHVVRVYETDLNISIPIKQLQKYLTAYGRKLLL